MKYFFQFPEHLSAGEIATLVNGIASFGNVSSLGGDRDFVVDVVRESKSPQLKKLLEHNERFGFMRWRTELGE